jgi:hypothetical protein
MKGYNRRPNYGDDKYIWRSDRFLVLLAFVLLVASFLFLK